jgi:hypothetical protein
MALTIKGVCVLGVPLRFGGKEFLGAAYFGE